MACSQRPLLAYCTSCIAVSQAEAAMVWGSVRQPSLRAGWGHSAAGCARSTHPPSTEMVGTTVWENSPDRTMLIICTPGTGPRWNSASSYGTVVFSVRCWTLRQGARTARPSAAMALPPQRVSPRPVINSVNVGKVCVRNLARTEYRDVVLSLRAPRTPRTPRDSHASAVNRRRWRAWRAGAQCGVARGPGWAKPRAIEGSAGTEARPMRL